MLCKINPTIGGATDQKARALNFLRALQAICTAPAGSTPSVPSQTAPTASPSGTNVITEVISNTESGGWALSPSTNITSNYNTSFASPYQLDLYRDSGKATYPYRKLSFRTHPAFLFNGTFTSYPRLWASYGFNTAVDASGNYLLGTDRTAFTSAVTNRYRQDANYDGQATDAATYNRMLAVDQTEWLIASTERYFMALSGNTVNGAGTFMYIGLRTTNTWEDQYDDNPPLVSLTYDGTEQYSAASPGVGYKAWMRTFQTTGTVNSLPAWYGTEIGGWNAYGFPTDPGSLTPTCPLSGWYNSTGSINSARASQFYWGNSLAVPVLPMGMMRSKFRDNTTMIGPVTDPSTGTLVPPAFPLMVSRNVQNSQNPGGSLIGVYKGLSGTDTFMQQYYTPGQTFVINNEPYYAYAIGNDTNHRDMFLIRKY